jgi:hypothetical protein
MWRVVLLSIRSLVGHQDGGGQGIRRSSVDAKVGEFVVVKGGVVRAVKRIIDGSGDGGGEIEVIFVGINGVIGPPFDDEPTGLDEGLFVVEGQGFNPGDGGVRDGNDEPAVARNPRPGRQTEKMVVALSVAGGREGNSPQGTSSYGVGGVGVFEELNVGTKLEAELIVIGSGGPGDKGGGAEGL